MPTDEAKQLWDAYQNDRSIENRNALAEFHLPMVRKLAAKQFRKLPPGSLVEVDDLVAFGCQGLFTAIERFDPSRGFEFSTFAGTRIHGAIIDGLRGMDWVPRLERNRQKSDPDLRIPEVGSLSTAVYDDSQRPIEIGDAIPDETQDSPDRRLESMDELRDALTGLSKIERLILLMYYYAGVTMREVGRNLGLSESRVSQIHSELMNRIRTRNGVPAMMPEKVAAAETHESQESPAEPHVSRLLHIWSEITPARLRKAIAEREREIETLRTILKLIEPLEVQTQSAETRQAPTTHVAPKFHRRNGEKTREEQIFEYIQSAGPSTPGQIIHGLGFGSTPQVVYQALHGSKHLTKNADGRYCISN